MADAQQAGKAMARKPALPEVSLGERREVTRGDVDVAVLESRGEVGAWRR